MNKFSLQILLLKVNFEYHENLCSRINQSIKGKLKETKIRLCLWITVMQKKKKKNVLFPKLLLFSLASLINEFVVISILNNLHFSLRRKMTNFA